MTCACGASPKACIRRFKDCAHFQQGRGSRIYYGRWNMPRTGGRRAKHK